MSYGSILDSFGSDALLNMNVEYTKLLICYTECEAFFTFIYVPVVSHFYIRVYICMCINLFLYNDSEPSYAFRNRRWVRNRRIVTATGFAETTTWFYMCLLLAGNWALVIYAAPDLCKSQVFCPHVFKCLLCVCFCLENLMQTGFWCRLSQEVTSALNHSQKCMYTQIFTFAAT